MIRFWYFILQTSLLKTIIWISEFTSFIHYRWVLQETLVACCRESQLSSPGSLEWPSFRERIWQIVAWHYPWLQAFVSSENSWKYYFQFPIFLIFDDKHLRSEIFYELRFSLPIRFQNTISIKDMPIYTDSQNCLWVSLDPLLIIVKTLTVALQSKLSNLWMHFYFRIQIQQLERKLNDSNLLNL